MSECLEQAKNFIKKSEYIQALNILEKLILKYPNRDDIAFELAKVYFFLKRLKDSEKLFFRIKEFSFYSSIFLAKIEVERKNYDKALSFLLEEKKCNMEILSEMAHIYKILADNKNLISIYNEILKLDPKNKQIKFELFKIYQLSKETEKEALDIALELVEDNSLTLRSRNIILNFIEYAMNKVVLKSVPPAIIVSLTSNCNLKCVMCGSYNFDWTISEKLEKEIIDLFPVIQEITYAGGEPFLYKNFEKMLDLGYKNNVCQRIITNGLFFNEDIADKLLKYNVQFHISVDAPNKKIYESIRKGANFDVLVKNLLMFKNKAYNKNSDLFLNCVVMEENYKYLEEMISFAKEFGFKKVFFLALNDKSVYSAEILEHIKNNIEVYYNIAKNKNIIIESPLLEFLSGTNTTKDICLKSDDEFICRLPWQRFFIKYDGKSLPDCVCFANSDGLLQNKTIMEVWNDDSFVNARKVISEKKHSLNCNKECLSGLFSKKYTMMYDRKIK